MSGPPWAAYVCLGASMALVGSYVGLSKLLLAVFPVFLLAWLRFGIGARRDARLAAAPAGRSAAVAARPPAALLGELPRQLPVLDLHAVRRDAELGRRGRRRDGRHPGGRGRCCRACSSTSASRRGWRPRIACAVAGIAAARLRPRRARWHAAPAASIGRWGNALLVGAVLCEASYVVIGKRLTGQVSAKRISALINLWGLAAGHAARPVAGVVVRLRAACRRRPGGCCCSTRWPPAWSPCGCG